MRCRPGRIRPKAAGTACVGQRRRNGLQSSRGKILPNSTARIPSADVDPPRTSPRPAGCRAAQTSATAAGASASADDCATAPTAGYRTAGHGATAPTAGYSTAAGRGATAPTAACSTTAACSSAAPTAAATALGYSLVKQASWSNLPVEDVEGRQADVGEFLVIQIKDGKGCGTLGRHIRGRRRRRCAAGDRQRRAGCSQER